MQIDFHHAVTYIIARCSGFGRDQAATIAHCAQYVDDATNGGTIEFTNKAMYSRISSSHKTFDYRNFKELANHQVWIPFHFLPANGGQPAGQDPEGSFIDKLVCRPGSRNSVADDMLRNAIADKDQAYALYRWGITMHVYADTWAHQGFAGVNHAINEVHDLAGDDDPNPAEGEESWFDKIKHKLASMTSELASDITPLGHGGALSAPDKPFLVWSYKNGRGEQVVRNNPKDFLEACEYMSRAMRRYQLGDASAEVAGLDPADNKQLGSMLAMRGDKNERYDHWKVALERGMFSCGAEPLPEYVHKGEGSWKHAALDTTHEHDKSDDTFEYSPAFLTSDWKLFHDALQRHRFAIIHEILPAYGISAG